MKSYILSNSSGSPQFTWRQQQVIGCLAAGMTETEIATRLCISPRTVRMHCDVVRIRLDVPKRRLIPVAYRERTGRDPLELKPNGLV